MASSTLRTFQVLAFVLLPVLTAGCESSEVSETEDPNAAEEQTNLAAVAALGDAHNALDAEGVMAVYDPKLVYHAGGVDHALTYDEIKESVESSFAAVPDLQGTYQDILPSGDKVTLRYELQASHPITKQPVFISGMAILRFEAGKIVEEWDYQVDGQVP